LEEIITNMKGRGDNDKEHGGTLQL